MRRYVGMALVIMAIACPSHGEAASATPRRVASKQVAKPKPPANPCAVYGAGFVAIEGTSTCIRIGGSVGVGSAF